ncbi:MAG: T9SS C-terminal target domain-containing protein [Flavobacterium sp.]|nr:MAG: T9SS C-terminal target domain-containing protein [Flavobacterium sp.]
MRKVVLLCVLCTLPVMLFGQSKSIRIDWGEKNSSQPSLNTSTEFSNLQKKNNESHTLELEGDWVKYSHIWEDTRPVNPNSIRLSGIKYGTLSADELSRIDRSVLPSNLTYTISSTYSRNKLYTAFTIVPVITENGILRKIESFTINYSYQTNFSGGNRMPITNSVLASGSWYKFRIEKTGIHRVDKSFLDNIGMNTDGIDPRTLKIYGHGGDPLPELNAANTEYDLPQNAIQVIGEEDGSFDSGDFILFYGKTAGFNSENPTNINPYSDETYYYITAGGEPGLRVQPMVEPSGNPTITISSFNDYQFHEEDAISPALVGRKWFGNRFDIESEQSFEFNFPNIVPGSELEIDIKVASASDIATSMAVSINGTSTNPLIFSPIADPKLLDLRELVSTFPASGETVKVDLTYNNAGNPASIGYLDYIRIGALRQLNGTGQQLSFRYNDAATLSGVGEYQLANASAFSQVWDVTEKGNITTKLNEGGNSTFSFKTFMGGVREYVAVNPADYFTPVQVAQSVVPNQDIKGTIFKDESGNFKDVDYIIVTPSFLLQPALRLARYRMDSDGLNVKVIPLDKIYEEFSSGQQDITAIRNMVKYVYDNASSPEKRVKYLCLFGDASVDYKDRLSNNTNIVPVYHLYDRQFQVSTFRSYMSDEYYAMMDPEDGTMALTDMSDIATGRILADNVSLANTLVDKIIEYDSKGSYGNWRNNFVLISDDADSRGDSRLQFDLDELGDDISAEKPFINVKKIHMDAYQQQTSAGGNRYPEVNEAVSNALEVGALVVNYFGHGGEDGLAKEFVFTKDQAIELQNKGKYPCVVTVTCEFTKFDNPLRTTAGELTYWNRNGGAIALITTTRSITVGTGVEYNIELAPELFGFGTNNINPPAEALRLARNLLPRIDRYVVFFVGDPAMHLAFPKQKVRLTTLNGVPIEQSTDTLQALSRVRLGGEVVDEAGNLLSNYNGVLEGKIYDKNVERQTLGNDGTREILPNGDPGPLIIMDFITLGEILFNGQATVNNGTFEFEFVVPRDIQIPVDTGRVSLYAQRNEQLEDQTGYDLRLRVGGLNENAPEDNEGPLISLFMNDESFVSGGITNNEPILIAKLEDENGINTASGIGHDITAIIDGDEANPFVLNEYYQAEVDDFTKGKATYKLRDLEKGLHTLTLKAWDVYNNSSTMDIQFVVAGNDELEVTRVLNYPNPFVNYTEFWFNHNRPFESLEVQVQVFTVTGKVVWTKNQIVNTDGFLSRDIVWDGLDDFGDKIGKGVYVYKLTVKSTLTNQQIEKFEKLVIL